MLKRKQTWAEKEFHDFLLARADMPFKWGINDCCLLVADAIQSFTDVDIAADFRGKYTTEIGAFRAIKTVTGGTTAEDAVAYCANKHSLVEYQHPLLAKRGDLVLVDNNGTPIAAVVHLSGRHVISVSETGLVRLPITAVRRAWSV